MMTMKKVWLVAVLTLCAGATASAFDLTVAQSEHGSVGFSVGGSTVTAAEAGKVVTVTVTPGEGYSQKDVTARAYTSWEAAARGARRAPALIGDITVTKQQDGTWQFTMPEADVQVKVEYYTDLPETNDGSWITANDDHRADIRLGRTLQTGGWNTLALPFSLLVPDGWTVKKLTGSSFDSGTRVLTLNFEGSETIEAGKPYLVKVDATVENPTFDGVDISKETQPFTSDNVDFIPTLGTTNITGEDAKTVFFVAAGNQLLNPTGLPANIKGFRAYFQLKGEAASVRSFQLNLDDGEATSIHEELRAKREESAGAVYDLQGRRVAQPTRPATKGGASAAGLKKGVYVVDGKKVIIK